MELLRVCFLFTSSKYLRFKMLFVEILLAKCISNISNGKQGGNYLSTLCRGLYGIVKIAVLNISILEEI